MIFKNFRSNFSHVCQDDISYPPYLEELNCYSDSELSFLNELRKDATDLATKLLTKKDNSMEDYKELLELLLFSFKVPSLKNLSSSKNQVQSTKLAGWRRSFMH